MGLLWLPITLRYFKSVFFLAFTIRSMRHPTIQAQVTGKCWESEVVLLTALLSICRVELACVYPSKLLKYWPYSAGNEKLGLREHLFIFYSPCFSCLFSPAGLNIKAKVFKLLWAPEGWNKLQILGASPSFGLNSFFYSSFPIKFSVPESPFSHPLLS